MLKLSQNIKTIIKYQNYHEMSKMLQNIKIIIKSKLLQMLKLLRNVRNVKIIMKTNKNLFILN